MSFNVWYRLSEYLYQCDEPDFDELRVAFKPFVEKFGIKFRIFKFNFILIIFGNSLKFIFIFLIFYGKLYII